MMSLNVTSTSGPGLFPYLGCSKLSCFMCNHFIQSYGQFTTRGSHGRLFKPWTVPPLDSLQHGQANRIVKALISVQEEVKKKLKEPFKSRVLLERTSVIGGSSVLAGHQEELSQ